MTLSQFVREYVLPECLIHNEPRSIKDHETTLKYWCQFTGDPALRQIDHRPIGEFLRGLKTLPGRDPGSKMSDSTVRKHATNVTMWLSRAGGIHDEGLALIAKPPKVRKPPKVFGAIKNVWTIPEIGLFLEACATMPQPSKLFGIRAAEFFRAMGVFNYNAPFRCETLQLLRWEWITEDELGKWIQVPAKALKQTNDQTLYLNRFALAAIEPLKALQSPLIFPWPHAESHLHRVKAQIVSRSAILAHRRNGYGFHSIRKCCATELAKINPMAAKWHLGHAQGQDVTLDYYVHRSALVEAVQKLPQPSWRADREGKQLLMF
jgi:integrase